MWRKLGIEPGEGRVFAWGTAVLALTGWADASLRNVAETLFLKRVGVDLLPVVFLANAVLLVGTTAWVGSSIARGDRLRAAPAPAGGARAAAAAARVARPERRRAGPPRPLDRLQAAADDLAAGVLERDGRPAPRAPGQAPVRAAGGRLHARRDRRQLRLGAARPMARRGGADSLRGGLRCCWPRRRRCRCARCARCASTAEPLRSLSERAGGASASRISGASSRLFRLLAISALCTGLLGPMLYYQFSYVADLATAGSGRRAPPARLLRALPRLDQQRCVAAPAGRHHPPLSPDRGAARGAGLAARVPDRLRRALAAALAADGRLRDGGDEARRRRRLRSRAADLLQPVSRGSTRACDGLARGSREAPGRRGRQPRHPRGGRARRGEPGGRGRAAGGRALVRRRCPALAPAIPRCCSRRRRSEGRASIPARRRRCSTRRRCARSRRSSARPTPRGVVWRSRSSPTLPTERRCAPSPKRRATRRPRRAVS